MLASEFDQPVEAVEVFVPLNDQRTIETPGRITGATLNVPAHTPTLAVNVYDGATHTTLFYVHFAGASDEVSTLNVSGLNHNAVGGLIVQTSITDDAPPTDEPLHIRFEYGE